MERYKDDCMRLKSELADRREETRQLQQRVRLLEGSLQVRMSQLEVLAEELLNSAPAGFQDAECNVACLTCGRSDRRLPELLEHLVTEARRTQVVLHSHADTGAHMEAKDRLLEQAEQEMKQQVHLKDQLYESRLETRRLAAKMREKSNDGGLKHRLEQMRRAALKQDELLAAYEQSHQELSERVQAVAARLDDERRARREQELIAQKLARELQEARQQLAKVSAFEAEALAGTSCNSQDDEGYSSALTLRLEHERRRTEERDQRRRLRSVDAPPKLPPHPARPQQDAVGSRGGSGSWGSVEAARLEAAGLRDSGGSWGSVETARLLSQAQSEAAEARAAEQRAKETTQLLAQALTDTGEEQEACRQDLEAARAELRLHAEARSQRLQPGSDASPLRGELHLRCMAAERQALTMAEVANEVAFQADLRQLQTLHQEVEMQRAFDNAEVAAELRCSMLAAIVNEASEAAAAAGAPSSPIMGRLAAGATMMAASAAASPLPRRGAG